jgi:hypothetical protein
MSNTEIDKVDLDGAARLLSELTLAMRWSEASLTVQTLPQLLEAEVEFLGESPALTIVDIVADLVNEDSPEAYSSAATALHDTARKFRSTILAAHHTNSNNQYAAPTLNDDRYKAMGRRAEVVLGLSKHHDALRLEVLKNRGGRAGYSVFLPFVPERGRVG